MTSNIELVAIGPTMPSLLAELHKAAFPEQPWSREALAGILNSASGFGWVAALDSAPGGFVLARGLVSDVEILSLGVLPAARRRGLGGALLEAVRRQAGQSGAERLVLEVAEDNGPARAFYKAAGFLEDGRRPGYYKRPGSPPVDALLLSFQLYT